MKIVTYCYSREFVHVFYVLKVDGQAEATIADIHVILDSNTGAGRTVDDQLLSLRVF